MKTNYRLLLSHAFAKLGDKNQKQLLGYYDKLSAKYGEDEAISMLYEAFRQLQEATASTSYKNLLSDTAKSIWNALDGKTIAVKTAIQRYREALQKAKSQEGKEKWSPELGQ